MRIPRAFVDALPLFEELEFAVHEMIVADGHGWEILPCEMTKQEKGEWCWSSVTQAVERTHGVHDSQCAIARDVIGNTLCGPTCGKSPCNTPQPLSSVLNIRGRFRPPLLGRIDFDDIKKEILIAKAVVCCRIDRAPNGHAIIICGFSEAGGTKRIAILDPANDVAPGPQAHDYNLFRIEYEAGGEWDATCLTQ
jgi:hypothetical protein